jgi:hypothetical protein
MLDAFRIGFGDNPMRKMILLVSLMILTAAAFALAQESDALPEPLPAETTAGDGLVM